VPRVVVIGGGHNGLVCAAYLARAGHDVTLLERRELLGGACVTEEIWPGYKISRAAYVLSLFRPVIARDLELARHGLELLPRRPSSVTPLPDGRSLVLGGDARANADEISRFSKRDARVYPDYEAFMAKIARALEPTLDAPPPELAFGRGRLKPWWLLARSGASLGRDAFRAARVLLGPARELIEEWFDSEPLRATLATDAVIGAFAAPSTPGTGYVLFHHVMGSITGETGVWAYVRGGMGALSEALASAARAAGATLRTEAPVSRVRVRNGRVCGVVLDGGEEIDADAVVSGADPRRTLALLEDTDLPEDYTRGLGTLDYRSPVVKVNLALSSTPEFPLRDRDEMPLTGTIHVGSEDMAAIERAYDQARAGQVSERPVVELTLPSSVDPSLAPEGHHVASVFAQYAPIRDADDPDWGELRSQALERVLALLDEVSPGFSSRVVHAEALAAPDLERVFGLSGGNIFHGAMTPDRLLSMRPLPGWAAHRTPLPGLWLCGSATHPGGGVMGAPGRNAALEITRTLRR